MDKEMIQKEIEQGRVLAPPVNIFEFEEEFLLQAEMPGVNKDGVQIKLADGNLSIFGKVDRQSGPREAYVVREIEEGNYYRVFRVSDTIDAEKIQASMSEGVLTLTLPKHERVKPREIPVEVA